MAEMSDVIKLAGMLEEGEKVDGLVAIVQQEFNTYSVARQERERTWLKLHYNYNGVYAPSEASDTTSKAFVSATRPRVQTAVSMLLPILLPPGDTIFTVDPTPKPKMRQLEEQLGMEGIPAEDIAKAVRKAAEAAASARQTMIADGLAEAEFNTKLQSVALDTALYGTGVMMGPFVASKMTRTYKRKGEPKETQTDMLKQYAELMMGNEPKAEEEYCPRIEYVSVWDFYPDNSARCIDECDSIIIRKVLSASQLRTMRDKDGFDSVAIDDVLGGDNGNWNAVWWESSMQRSNRENQTKQKRYEVYVRWGYLTGLQLRNAGYDVPDDHLQRQIMCTVWTCGKHVIFIGNSELHCDRIPVYAVPWSTIPTSIWGVGVAESMRDSQDAINACERSKLDNMALSSRPQVVVYADRMLPGHNNLEMKAGRIWPVVSSETGTGKPVEFFVPDCRLDQINAVQSAHMQFVDEQTALPRLLMGMGGEGIHNRTLGGANLQFSNAVSTLKGVVFNYEHFLIIPLVKALSRFYDEFSDDETIKGDHKIIARGLSGLMMREAIAGSIQSFMALASQAPEMAQRIDPDRIFALVQRGSGLEPFRVTYTEEEFNQRMQAAQEAEATNKLAQEELAMQMQQKQKAQTAPNDALLQVFNETQDDTPLKVVLARQVLEAFGQLTPEIEAAMAGQMKAMEIGMVNEAHRAGSEMADRETPEPEKPSARNAKR